MPPTRSSPSYSKIPTSSPISPRPPGGWFVHLDKGHDVQSERDEKHIIGSESEHEEGAEEGLNRAASAPATRVGTPIVTPPVSPSHGTTTSSAPSPVKVSPAELYLGYEDSRASVASDEYFTCPLAPGSPATTPMPVPTPDSSPEPDDPNDLDYEEDEEQMVVDKGARVCRPPPGYASNASTECHWWHTRSVNITQGPLDTIVAKAAGDIVWNQYSEDDHQGNTYWVWDGVHWQTALPGSPHPVYGPEKHLKHDLNSRNKGPQWVSASTYQRWRADVSKNKTVTSYPI